MADIRIKDLTSEASTSVTGDFLPIDGSIGTRKLSAYNPTFGGNATLGGTLTVNGAGSSAFATTTGFSISTGVTTPSGGVGVGAIGTGGSFYVNTPSLNSNYGSGLAIDGSYPGGTGAQSVVNVKAFGVMSGGGYGSTLSFQTTLNGTFNEVMKLTSGSVVQVLGTTASTTTSSGALVVGNGTSGGLGVGGAVNIGSTLTVGGQDLILAQSGVVNWTIRNTTTSGLLDIRNGSGSFLTFPVSAGTVEFNATNASTVKVAATTASTGTSSGALVVSGGVGVAGAIYAGGKISLTAGTTSTYGVTFGDIDLYRSASGILSLTSGTFTGGVGAGFFTINSSGAQPLVFATDATERARVDGTNFTISSGIGLKLGNAYVAGAPTATGYIVIKDSTGTSYKIPAVAL